MIKAQRNILTLACAILFLFSVTIFATAQGLSAGTISGVVVDPNNAVVPNATVTLENSVTGFTRSFNTSTDGSFRFDNVPFNNYVYNVSAAGFAPIRGAINIR